MRVLFGRLCAAALVGGPLVGVASGVERHGPFATVALGLGGCDVRMGIGRPEETRSRSFLLLLPRFQAGGFVSDHFLLHFDMEMNFWNWSGMSRFYRDYFELLSSHDSDRYWERALATMGAPLVIPLAPFVMAQHTIGCGCTWFHRPAAPSLFVDAAGGLTHVGSVFAPCVRAAVGFEFLPGVNTSLGVSWARCRWTALDPRGFPARYSGSMFAVTLAWGGAHYC
jgi:hypothetical protein